MAQTIRHYWGAFQGRVTLNYNWPIINSNSVVLVSVSEYVTQNPPSDDYRFIGDASITVENIAPHGPPFNPNNGVTFVVNVDWSTPLNIVTDITVLDNAPIEIDYPSAADVATVGNATTASFKGALSAGKTASSKGTTSEKIVG